MDFRKLDHENTYYNLTGGKVNQKFSMWEGRGDLISNRFLNYKMQSSTLTLANQKVLPFVLKRYRSYNVEQMWVSFDATKLAFPFYHFQTW